MIRALALDVDGTLLTSDAGVSAKTVQALSQFLAAEPGRLLVIASARPPSAVKPIVAALGQGTIAYAVCGEGNMLLEIDDAEWKPIWRYWSEWTEMKGVMAAMEKELSRHGGGVWAVGPL